MSFSSIRVKYREDANSTKNITSIAVMAINPAIEGYCSVKNGGRHGDVRLANALGSNFNQSHDRT